MLYTFYYIQLIFHNVKNAFQLCIEHWKLAIFSRKLFSYSNKTKFQCCFTLFLLRLQSLLACVISNFVLENIWRNGGVRLRLGWMSGDSNKVKRWPCYMKMGKQGDMVRPQENPLCIILRLKSLQALHLPKVHFLLLLLLAVWQRTSGEVNSAVFTISPSWHTFDGKL